MGGEAETVSRRYLVLVAKFGTHFFHVGMMKSMGTIIPSMVVQYDSTYATVGFLVSLQIAMTWITAPFAQLLISKHGPRPVATIGGLGSGLFLIGVTFTRSLTVLGFILFAMGVCSSTVLQASYVAMKYHFADTFNAMITLTQLGHVLGGLVMTSVTHLLMSTYGLQGALLCIGGLMMNTGVFGALFHVPESVWLPRKTEGTATETSSSDRKIKTPPLPTTGDSSTSSIAGETPLLTSDQANGEDCGLIKHKDAALDTHARASYLWMVLDTLATVLGLKVMRQELVFSLVLIPCQLIQDVVVLGWMLFLVSFGIDAGLDEASASLLPLAGAAGGCLSRVLLAIALMFFPNGAMEMLTLAFSFSGVTLFFTLLHSSLSYLLTLSFLSGMGFYALLPICYAALSTRVRDENYFTALGISLAATGLCSILTGIGSGFIYDVTGSFRMVFEFFGAGCAIASVSTGLFVIYERCYKSRT